MCECESLDRVEALLAERPRERSELIPLLQDIQRECRYLPAGALRRVAEHLGVPLSKVYSVATFYKAFSLEPRGRTVIKVCTGTACHIRGAPQIVDELCRVLGVSPGGTTADGSFTVETVNCVGACAMAPLVLVNGEYHGHITPSRARELVEQGEADEDR
jgi:NADH-quinone oxidoreductase subunit E